MRALLIVAALSLCACSLFTVEQDPFPQLDITADRPPPGPPRVVLTASSIQIADKIQFATGSADILPVSFPLLDEIVKVMEDNPQITKIQIEGHTDSDGADAYNLSLSQKRANSVKAYIAKKGIAAKRLVAKGFGESKPIADNATPEGREANRRVEFNILEQGPKKTIVKDED